MQKTNTDLAQFHDQETFDLVVLGSGAAGMSAAVNAVIQGAKVLLVERTNLLGGTTAWSAATTWIPCTAPGLKVNPDDTRENAARFLDLAVGARSDRRMRDAFLDNGPAAVSQLEAHTALQFQVRTLHPDYMSELEGAVLRGRAIEPRPFDGNQLGPNLMLLRPPIPEFTVLGGMMVDRDDIFHLLRITKTCPSFSHSLRIIARHVWDKLFHPRSTRLVMGNALIARLLWSYLQKGGHVVTHTEAVELHRNGQGINGITVRQSTSSQHNCQRTFKVSGGVVLATGGFNRHPEHRSRMLPGVTAEWCPAAPGHTGSAQALALQLGARFGKDAWSHAFWAPVSIRQRHDGSTAVFPHFVMDRGKPGMLTVDQLGHRFLNESSSYHVFGVRMQEHNAQTPCIPSWLICDADALKRYGMGMVRPGGQGLRPFLRDGYLKTGATLADLAHQLNIPASTLEATIERFNQQAETGIDSDFQRGTTDYQRANGDATWPGPNPCLGPLRTGPFYAVALYPGDIGAATGLITDTHAQVLGVDDQPIGGLYACGNDMHSIMGGTYPAPGITIGPAITFGFIAARHALQRAINAAH